MSASARRSYRRRMGRTLGAINFGHWNLSDQTDGYSGGSWQHDDHALLTDPGSLREVSVAVAGFQPLHEDARHSAAWIGITQASGTDGGGNRFEIDADLGNPLSWPRVLIGHFISFRVSMVVFHANAGFDYMVRTYDG